MASNTHHRWAIGIIPLLIAVWLVGYGSLKGQEGAGESFDDQSLKYRTALHYDPLLESALDSLVELYGGLDRIDELLGLYRSHVEQYSDDAGAKTVLIRLMQTLNREGGDELLVSAVPIHPDYAPLQYLLYLFLKSKGDERALETLSRAIDLETNPGRQSDWLEILLVEANEEDGRDLAEIQLRKLLEKGDQTPEGLLSLARLMQRFQFWELSAQALNKAREGDTEAEAGIEVDVLLSKALLESDEREKAASILDQVLDRLAADHWRRREIMSMRIGMVATDEERNQLLERYRKAYEENPNSEGVVLDFADILLASEKQGEAADLLVRAASRLPKSEAVENRALELIRATNNPEALEEFLDDRLEINPERRDLRLELVKVRYLLGLDGAASQDFEAVIAGLEPGEASTQILELQRYLRGIEREDAAISYLGRYLEKNPERLDVARELAELYVLSDKQEEIDKMIDRLEVAESAPENVVDFVEFLVDEGFVVGARRITVEKLGSASENFELGLLLVEILGKLGDQIAAGRQIDLVRSKADSPERYSRWLRSSMFAHQQLGSLDQFLESEENRFAFSDEEWPEAKVERFIILCEAGGEKLSTARIANALKARLDRNNMDSQLRVRLRRFLVGLLENDPAASREVEEQLAALEVEDPIRRVEYELKRALIHHRLQEVDRSQALLAKVDPSQVRSPNLLREAVEALFEYRFFAEADRFLAELIELEPEDVFSWSRRLSLLAAKKDEGMFRIVARKLLREEGGVKLSAESASELTDHLIASYWRSISRLMTQSDEAAMEEVLTLLASLDREVQSPEKRLWTEWARHVTLHQLGRDDEGDESKTRFLASLEEQGEAEVTFPDGLALDGEALRLKMSSEESEEDFTMMGAGFLLFNPSIKWAFEGDRDATLVKAWNGKDIVLVLDENETLYGLNKETGKLAWRQFGSVAKRGKQFGRPAFMRGTLALSQEPVAEMDLARRVEVPRRIAAVPGGFVRLREAAIECYTEDAVLMWKASLPFSSHPKGPRDILVTSGNYVVAFRAVSQEVAGFDAASGKLLWAHSGSEVDGEVDWLNALNSGAQIDGNRVLLSGRETGVLDLSSGQSIWHLGSRVKRSFPVSLRKERLESGERDQEEVRSESEEFREPLRYMGYLNSESDELLSNLLFGGYGNGAILSSGQFWGKTRATQGSTAMASLSDGYLWLMQGEQVSRISVEVPVGSTQHSATGVFLGAKRNQAWFLKKEVLQYVNFDQGISREIEIGDLGESGRLRGTVNGNQLIVTGRYGLKLFNFLTGELIGQSLWPEELTRYLESLDSNSSPVSEVWQGVIEGREAFVCRPIGDEIGEGKFFALFDGKSLVCLEPEEEGAAQ